MFKRKYAWAIIYGLLLTAFTVYISLDTFVITRIYAQVPARTGASAADDGAETAADDTETAADDAAPVEPVEDDAASDVDEANGSASGENYAESADEISQAEYPVVTANSYADENISITITTYREYDTDIYVADVVLKSADYLYTALANNSYGRNVTQKTSEIAEANGAILAINGDYYASRERGYVIRNGVLYRESAASSQEDLVIYSDGSFEIIEERDVSAQSLVEAGAAQVLSFGPSLIIDGEITVTADSEVGRASASNPRTAIGIIGDMHYVFVVSDGRTNQSVGLSLEQLAEFMQSLGVITGYNLDGGGSSTMYFNGEIINNPTTNGRSIRERSVSDIVCIG
ncbi:MAG: phosphodiester glycosidase family protein [Clostridia bacterium]|nr:phosphodiester glycosidase family protein [Clostridia bacterium]